MAFKMKAGKEGPMKKNFGSALKKNKKPTLPTNEPDKTRTSKTLANITKDAVERKKRTDKIERRHAAGGLYGTSVHGPTSAKSLYSTVDGRFVDKFFKTKSRKK